MNEKKVGAYATCTLTIEVYSLGSWGGECALSQIHKQAAEAAIGRIQRLETQHNFRLVGEPDVKAIITEKQP